MACNEPSHQDIHCLLFCSIFLSDILICNNGHIQIQWQKGPLQKLGDERELCQLTGFRGPWFYSGDLGLYYVTVSYVANFTISKDTSTNLS